MSDGELLAHLRLLTRQTLAQVDESRALVVATGRLLSDRPLWRRLQSPAFGADEAADQNREEDTNGR